MNTAAIYIYLASVINALDNFLTLLSFVGLISWTIYTLFYYVECDRYHGKTWVVIWSIAALFVTVFIPSTKTMYMMAGAVLGEKAIESEIGQQTFELIQLKIKEELDNMRKTK